MIEWLSIEKYLPANARDILIKTQFKTGEDTITRIFYGYYNSEAVHIDKWVVWDMRQLCWDELLEGYEVIEWMDVPE
jgi:hypothetical protein